MRVHTGQLPRHTSPQRASTARGRALGHRHGVEAHEGVPARLGRRAVQRRGVVARAGGRVDGDRAAPRRGETVRVGLPGTPHGHVARCHNLGAGEKVVEQRQVRRAHNDIEEVQRHVRGIVHLGANVAGAEPRRAALCVHEHDTPGGECVEVLAAHNKAHGHVAGVDAHGQPLVHADIGRKAVARRHAARPPAARAVGGARDRRVRAAGAIVSRGARRACPVGKGAGHARACICVVECACVRGARRRGAVAADVRRRTPLAPVLGRRAEKVGTCAVLERARAWRRRAVGWTRLCGARAPGAKFAMRAQCAPALERGVAGIHAPARTGARGGCRVAEALVAQGAAVRRRRRRRPRPHAGCVYLGAGVAERRR